MSDKGLPDVHFGEVSEPKDQVLESTVGLEDDDDDELLETPPDVTDILGFDPKDLDKD